MSAAGALPRRPRRRGGPRPRRAVPGAAARAARPAPGRPRPHGQLRARRGLRAGGRRPPARARRHRVPRDPAARPRLPGAAAGAGRWSREAERRARRDAAWRVDIEFGPAEDGLPRAAAPGRRSSSTTCARTAGRGGPPDLLARIPPFGPEDIPREDAVHLLFNRAIEQLEAWDRVERADGEALLDLAYQRLKLALDLAGSALAFDGRPRVRLRRAAGARSPRCCAARPALAARLPAEFDAELERAAARSSSPPRPTTSCRPDRPPRSARGCAREIAAAVPALAGTPALGARRPARRRRAAADPARALGGARRRWRARAYGNGRKLALHPDAGAAAAERAAGGRGWPWRSTPRALAYAAGAHRLPGARPAATAHRRGRGPAPAGGARRRPPPPPSAAAITAFWRWCIRND